MSIRLNGDGAFLQIDLTATHVVTPASEALTVCCWLKKVGNFVDNDPFVALAASATSRASSIETYNDGTAGALGTFESGSNGSGIGHGSPDIAVDDWFFVAFRRSAGASVSAGPVDCGDEIALTTHDNFATYAHSSDFRYITIGELAQQGLVTSFNGEVARVRAWNVELSQAQLEAERDSTTPIITSGLLCSMPFGSITDQTDQSGNGLSWTESESGTIQNGASDPPGGAGGNIAVKAAYYRMMMNNN